MYDIVADQDLTCNVSRVLARGFDADIRCINLIAFDDDVSAAVYVKSVGVVLISFSWIVNSADIVNRIARKRAATSVVVGCLRGSSLKADGVDADVIVVM